MCVLITGHIKILSSTVERDTDLADKRCAWLEFRYQYYRCYLFSFVDLLFSEISLKMKYCEILFDLENIFDILIRAASWQSISNTNNDE